MPFVTNMMTTALMMYRASKNFNYIDPDLSKGFVARMSRLLRKLRPKFYKNKFRREEHDEVARKLWEEDLTKIIHSCPINPCQLTAPDCNLPTPTTSTMPPPSTKSWWHPTTTRKPTEKYVCPAYWSGKFCSFESMYMVNDTCFQLPTSRFLHLIFLTFRQEANWWHHWNIQKAIKIYFDRNLWSVEVISQRVKEGRRSDNTQIHLLNCFRWLKR